MREHGERRFLWQTLRVYNRLSGHIYVLFFEYFNCDVNITATREEGGESKHVRHEV